MEETAPPSSHLGNLEVFLSSSTSGGPKCAVGLSVPRANQLRLRAAPVLPVGSEGRIPTARSDPGTYFPDCDTVIIFSTSQRDLWSRVFTVWSFQRPKTKFVFSRLMWRQRRTWGRRREETKGRRPPWLKPLCKLAEQWKFKYWRKCEKRKCEVNS